MKQVRFAQSVAVLLEDSVKTLVEKNYFSEEEIMRYPISVTWRVSLC